MSDDLETIARRHGVSAAAADQVLGALRSTGGTLAQFDHPDLGGRGQWMPGMVQIGDMFNDALKARVAALCTELSALARREASRTAIEGGKPSAANWGPAHYGTPSTAGGQDDVRYAYFGRKRRLLVDVAGYVVAYQTGDHIIMGVQQSQGSASSLTFTSQHGPVSLESLEPAPLDEPAE